MLPDPDVYNSTLIQLGQKEPVCEETTASPDQQRPVNKRPVGLDTHKQDQCGHKREKPQTWPSIQRWRSNACLKCVYVCVSVLPSSWVATVIRAELSPGPLALDATTRKVYLVSGMRFWMVTCISPGPLVFSTRSLRAKQQQYEIKIVQTCQSGTCMQMFLA